MSIRCLVITVLLLAPCALRSEEAITLQSGESQTLLLELYTSQGCSSCPPAEKWMGGLVDDRRLWREIIPVAFHVDYWDWIGWKDPFASAEYTKRQRAYGKIKHVESIYTPCFIANGREWRAWFTLHRKLPTASVLAGNLSAQIINRQVSARYSRPSGKLMLNVALLGIGHKTKVTRGENAGRELKHDFSVLGWSTHPSTNAMWSIELPRPQHQKAKRYAVAIWISQPQSGVPIQATGGWLPGYRLPIDS